jgi:hypothetical protein
VSSHPTAQMRSSEQSCSARMPKSIGKKRWRCTKKSNTGCSSALAAMRFSPGGTSSGDGELFRGFWSLLFRPVSSPNDHPPANRLLTSRMSVVILWRKDLLSSATISRPQPLTKLQSAGLRLVKQPLQRLRTNLNRTCQAVIRENARKRNLRTFS